MTRMDRRTVFTKTAKGMLEATGKTSTLSRDLRNILKEVDGKATVGKLAEKLGKITEPKLLESLGKMLGDGYVREFVTGQQTAQQTSAPPSQSPAASGGEDLDFSSLTAKPASRADEAARQKAEAEARARAETAAKAKAEAEARARAEAAAKAKAEAEARARAEAAAKAKAEAEAEARAEAEAEVRGRREAEEKARREAEERAQRDAQERARVEAEFKERLEEERRAREEAERKAKDDAQRLAREAEERARREAEEKGRREADELRAQLEAERKAREEAERRAKDEEERRARDEAERRTREEAERKAREEAERRAKEDAERKAKEEEGERRTREEAERRAREETERRAKEEAERKAKEEEEERRTREEAERRAREETERRAKEEAERRAKKEEEERRTREEAKRRAREETERRAKEEEERWIREDAERRAREETERRAKEEARRTREEAERRAREEAERETKEQEAREERERQAEREAEQTREESKTRASMEAEAAAQARKDARARERALAKEHKVARIEESPPPAPEEPPRQVPEEPEPSVEIPVRKPRRKRNWARITALGLFVVLIVAIAAIHVVPLDVAPYEKAAQERFGEPVRIGSIHYSLFPRPHLNFERISIGTEPQLRIGSMKAVSALGSMFAPRKVFTSVEMEGLVLPPAIAARAMWGKGSDDAMRVERVLVKGLKFELNGMALPRLDVEASFGPGGLEKAQLANAETDLTVSLQTVEGKTQVEIAAKRLVLPFAESVVLDEFAGKGTLGAQELTLREFDARAFDGALTGNARLSWRDGWSFEGELVAKRMDAAKLAAPVLSGGQFEGKGVYRMRAAAPEKLMATARLEGSFSVQKGTVANIDLTRTLQGTTSSGGNTLFSEMTGSAVADAGRIQLRQIRLSAGLLSANGAADVDERKNLSGRLQIELRSQAAPFRANLAVSGTLAQPQFRRSN